MLFSSLVVLPVLASTVTALGSNYTVPPDFNAGAISSEEKGALLAPLEELLNWSIY